MKKIVMVIALSALSLAPALNAGNEQTATQPTRFKKALAQLSRPAHFGYGAFKIATAGGIAALGTLLLMKGSGCYSKRRPKGMPDAPAVAKWSLPSMQYGFLGLATELTLLSGALGIARSGVDSLRKAFIKAA